MKNIHYDKNKIHHLIFLIASLILLPGLANAGEIHWNNDYEKLAEKAIQASVSNTILKREGRIIGNFVTALEVITAGYLEFSIVGDPHHKKAKSLFKSSGEIFNMRKVQHYERPGRYPDLGYPAVYICSINACSRPLSSSVDIEREAIKFIEFE